MLFYFVTFFLANGKKKVNETGGSWEVNGKGEPIIELDSVSCIRIESWQLHRWDQKNCSVMRKRISLFFFSKWENITCSWYLYTSFFRIIKNFFLWNFESEVRNLRDINGHLYYFLTTPFCVLYVSEQNRAYCVN